MPKGLVGHRGVAYKYPDDVSNENYDTSEEITFMEGPEKQSYTL